MIHVSCGHEKGIGLEVFLKSYLTLTLKEQSQFNLHIEKAVLETYLKTIGMPCQFRNNSFLLTNTYLNCHFIKNEKNLPSSTASLNSCLKNIRKNEILLTLPTSKDQLIFKNKNAAGYTEFLRLWAKNKYITMCFQSPNHFIGLITDHWALKDVPKKCTANLIFLKTCTAIDGYKNFLGNIDEVIISGLNPHAGEGGLLGTEDVKIKQAINKLRKTYPDITILGPLSGDTLHNYHSQLKKQIFIYMFHDQGLSYFKGLNHTMGTNISFGLPFLRLSVDHGTAFNLYGKNTANYAGCFYTMKTALKIQAQKA